MILFKSLLENTNVVADDPKLFLWIAASANDAAAVNSIVIKTFLANSLSAFLIKSKPLFSNGLKSPPKIYPDCPVLSKWVFDIFI